MASNTTSDDQPSLDAVAANLQETAKSTLETAQKNAKEGQEAGVSLVQKVATVVLDKGNQAADSSKTYLANVVHQVQDFAEHASHSGVPQGLQDSVSKALHLGGGGSGAAADQPSSNNTNGAADTSTNSLGTAANGLIASILAWIAQLCGSKKEGGGAESPAAADPTASLRAAAEQVSSVLHDTTNSIVSATHPPPAAAAAAEESH
ncbi:unnamed protein product [Sphagnum troendelagicum]|uniref:Uncharacterized protein n=1 Tax=Sphagnum troendelagicum TaxID=128251 RepID=A0ABP0UN02_9BRYO